jgi:hypothetical protein
LDRAVDSDGTVAPIPRAVGQLSRDGKSNRAESFGRSILPLINNGSKEEADLPSRHISL